jgi:hypothetical protein
MRHDRTYEQLQKWWEVGTTFVVLVTYGSMMNHKDGGKTKQTPSPLSFNLRVFAKKKSCPSRENRMVETKCCEVPEEKYQFCGTKYQHSEK